MNKATFIIELTFTKTYEVDLDSESYESFTTFKEALESDTRSYHDEPMYMLDSNATKIRTRGRIQDTNIDCLLTDDYGEDES